MLGNGRVGAAAWDVDRGQHELLLFGGGEDFIEVDGDAKGNEEEAADARAEPVWRLKWGGCHQLRVEGVGAVGSEDFGLVGGEEVGGF